MKIFLQVIALFVILAIVGFVLSVVIARRPPPEPTPAAVSTSTSTEPVTSSIAVSIEMIREQGTSSPAISVEYPQFPSLSKEFNASIKQTVLERLNEFKKAAKEIPVGLNVSDLSFTSRWEAAQVNNRYVSFIMRFESYTGGAHENQDVKTFNYDVGGKTEVSLGDLFPDDARYLEDLSLESRQQLVNKFRSMGADGSLTEVLLDGTEPSEQSFQHFTFTENALKIYFPKYSVAAGALGEQFVVIPGKFPRARE